jgi:hypothetical protein
MQFLYFDKITRLFTIQRVKQNSQALPLCSDQFMSRFLNKTMGSSLPPGCSICDFDQAFVCEDLLLDYVLLMKRPFNRWVLKAFIR